MAFNRAFYGIAAGFGLMTVVSVLSASGAFAQGPLAGQVEKQGAIDGQINSSQPAVSRFRLRRPVADLLEAAQTPASAPASAPAFTPTLNGAASAEDQNIPTAQAQLNQISVPVQQANIPDYSPSKCCPSCMYRNHIDKIVERDTGRVILQVDHRMTPRELLELAFKSNIDLRNANLHGLNLVQVQLPGADLSGCDLTCAELTQANLDGCNFSNAVIDKTCFVQAHLRSTKLAGLTINDSKFGQAKMQHAVFDGSRLQSCDFGQTWVHHASLQNCVFSNSECTQLFAHAADFSNCQIGDCKFGQADFSGSNLSGMTFDRSDLVQAFFYDCNLGNCQFHKVGLTQASVNKHTIMAQAKIDGWAFHWRVSPMYILMDNKHGPDYKDDEK